MVGLVVRNFLVALREGVVGEGEDAVSVGPVKDVQRDWKEVSPGHGSDGLGGSRAASA